VGFYLHLTAPAFVNALFLVVKLVTSTNALRFYWSLIGWGIGIVAHAASVFGTGRFWGKEWNERKIKVLMDKGKYK
jgi:hypothetical protein